MPPAAMSARTKDIPRVLRAGKREGLTAKEEKPVCSKSPGDLIPAKTKSSTVASEEFLHTVDVMVMCLVWFVWIGMQKSMIGSGSEMAKNSWSAMDNEKWRANIEYSLVDMFVKTSYR